MFYTFISSCFAKLEKQLFYLVINLFLFFSPVQIIWNLDLA